MQTSKTPLKKLLFLYPVKEFFWYKPKQQHLPKLMNSMINERYRNKGYEINFLVFGDREVTNLAVESQDRVLKSDVNLLPAIEQGTAIPYTDNKLIGKLLGPVDELVVCGFHEIDCVRKVARYFYDNGIDTLVDIELTNNLDELSKLACFNIQNYNLADIIECNFAKAVNKDGEDSYVYSSGGGIYGESPYYKLKTFTPTHTWQEWLEIIKKKETSCGLFDDQPATPFKSKLL